MNYTNLVGIAVSSHADIDFVDVRVDADTALYIDPERIALSQHPFAIMADEVINDFFAVLCRAAAAHNEVDMYHLLSYGREPNETHLGLSSSHSCGRGTTPEILMPIIKSMISMRLFENKLITQLVDLQLWTPNFHYDRLSDLEETSYVLFWWTTLTHSMMLGTFPFLKLSIMLLIHGMPIRTVG